MLATLIPFFDKNMKVNSYSLFCQEKNLLLNPALQSTGRFDGATTVQGLEVIKSIGIDTLAPGTDVFVPVNQVSVFSNIEEECDSLGGRLTLLLDGISNTEQYLVRLSALKEAGYKLAIRKLPVAAFSTSKEILNLMDYILLDCKAIDVKKAKIYFGALHPSIKICVGNIDDQTFYDEIKDDPAFSLFEGSFFRLPITKDDNEVSPLKATYLQLLDTVNAPDFELTEAADIIGRDTALVVSLLDIVNKMARNSEVTSIRHAAAMLGQKELKKWINTAVTKELCSDRPNEITRLSLLRAKFAENLAPLFDLSGKTSELFLMGLFSVLDLILGIPMEEALAKVNVSKEITNALVKKEGELARAFDFITCYENADWQEVCRQMIVENIDMNQIYDAYIESVRWYRDLFSA